MSIRSIFFICVWLTTSFSCGGGGSGSRIGPISVTPFDSGGVTVLVGDNALVGIAAVNIDIDEIVLIGAGGQMVVVSDNIGVINLLELQNITTLVADTDVPSRTYNKIRLSITSIELVEDDGDMFMAQLPANGRVDLNPQGPFEVEPDEDLVLQLDFDLQRSLQIVQTGNSPYRFRPVVFVDVIEQGSSPRLSRLLGTVEDDAVSGELSDFDLCDIAAPTQCIDVQLNTDPLLLLEDGTLTSLDNIALSARASVFGRYFVSNGLPSLFDADIVVLGNEGSLVQIDGVVTSTLVNNEFDIQQAEVSVATTVSLFDQAKLFNAQGELLTESITIGSSAEVWGQRSQVAGTTVDEFSAFAVQVKDLASEDSLAGALDSISDDQLMITNPQGTFCVQVGASTTYQLISGFDSEAESQVTTLSGLMDLLAASTAVQVDAFGTQGNVCLDASFVVAETD